MRTFFSSAPRLRAGRLGLRFGSDGAGGGVQGEESRAVLAGEPFSIFKAGTIGAFY
ncbi:hypothetical protein HYT00_01375 [Candidatus Giovannonibacteria bacterium]|nr:hypothetical protein [Candidatus Giovannonibacteria bacterium]